MKKYYIEGNINFYDELYKTLDEEENDEEDNICLITKMPLKDRYYKMQCGHKFNYEAIYNDLVNYKGKFNNMEKAGDRLDKNEIRCPYCRHRQKTLLPYYDDMSFAKIKGVNSLFEDKTIDVSKYNRCQLIYPSNTIDGTDIQCCKFGYNLNTMVYHINNYITSKNLPMIETDKVYCHMHGKIIIKEYAKTQKDIQKQKIKEIKEADKQKEKEMKLIQKQKEKEERQQMKKKILEKEIADETNDIIQIDIDKCVEILKGGENKGQKCNKQVFNDCLCKRHYNLKNKDKK
jgi:hypothetical protein